MQEIQHYYLNSMPKVGTPFENHDTFPEGYTAVIPVMGGGTVLYHQADRNCRAIDNCGRVLAARAAESRPAGTFPTRRTW